MNPFPYAFDNKRYHTLAYHNRQHNCKTQKAVLDAGLTCPNLDGTCGVGGCIFCDGGSGGFTPDSRLTITQQIAVETERIRRKQPDAAVIAYFQAHTNTYAPIPVLRRLYREALDAGVAGLSIATRPDCIDDAVLALLCEVAAEKPLTVELGLQTSNDETAVRIHRGYAYATFVECFMRLRNAGLRICVHLIDGLPGEDTSQMLETAAALARLKPDALKIHLLHVLRGTPLAKLWESGQYTPMTLDAYIDIVVRQLELLPPETVIERITGDGDKKKLLAPLWSRDKIRVLGSIDRAMAERNTWQGRLYSPDDLHL